MNPHPNGWILSIETGSYDDHAYTTIGFFCDETDARTRFDALSKELGEYKRSIPRPHVDDLVAQGHDPNDANTFMLLSKLDKKWRHDNIDHEHFDTRSYRLEEWIHGDTTPVRRIKSESFPYGFR